jgi:hypothetical protein
LSAGGQKEKHIVPMQLPHPIWDKSLIPAQKSDDHDDVVLTSANSAVILFVTDACFAIKNLLNDNALQSFYPLIKKEDYLFPA